VEHILFSFPLPQYALFPPPPARARRLFFLWTVPGENPFPIAPDPAQGPLSLKNASVRSLSFFLSWISGRETLFPLFFAVGGRWNEKSARPDRRQGLFFFPTRTGPVFSFPPFFLPLKPRSFSLMKAGMSATPSSQGPRSDGFFSFGTTSCGLFSFPFPDLRAPPFFFLPPLTLEAFLGILTALPSPLPSFLFFVLKVCIFALSGSYARIRYLFLPFPRGSPPSFFSLKVWTRRFFSYSNDLSWSRLPGVFSPFLPC